MPGTSIKPVNDTATAEPASARSGTGEAMLITISIPVCNEEENVGPLLKRLRAVADSLPRYRFEFLFTDNASEDATFERLLDESKLDRRVRALRFTRNVGFQHSILANYLEARGQAVIQIDADMEDPPELIGEMIEHWEKGYKVVYGIRRRRQESALKTALRKLYYRLVNRLSEVDLPHDAGDFRLIDRVVVDRLRETHDANPYLRGLISSFAYPQTGIVYDRAARTAGVSKFNFAKLLRLAVDGICSQSTKPLEIITFSGFLLSFIAVIAACAYAVWYFTTDDARPGFTTLVLLTLLTAGINMAFLGVLGEYVGRIFRNTRTVPTAIVQRRIEPLNTQNADEKGMSL